MVQFGGGDSSYLYIIKYENWLLSYFYVIFVTILLCVAMCVREVLLIFFISG